MIFLISIKEKGRVIWKFTSFLRLCFQLLGYFHFDFFLNKLCDLVYIKTSSRWPGLYFGWDTLSFDSCCNTALFIYPHGWDKSPHNCVAFSKRGFRTAQAVAQKGAGPPRPLGRKHLWEDWWNLFCNLSWHNTRLQIFCCCWLKQKVTSTTIE